MPRIQSSHAILLLEDHYVLQLRDNKKGIAAPGQWALFGGLKQSEETPLQAIQREIYEELLVTPPQYRYLWFADYFADFEAELIRTWFFVSDVSPVWPDHELQEGQAVGLFPFGKISCLAMPPVMRETIERFHRTHVRGNGDK